MKAWSDLSDDERRLDIAAFNASLRSEVEYKSPIHSYVPVPGFPSRRKAFKAPYPPPHSLGALLVASKSPSWPGWADFQCRYDSLELAPRHFLAELGNRYVSRSLAAGDGWFYSSGFIRCFLGVPVKPCDFDLPCINRQSIPVSAKKSTSR